MIFTTETNWFMDLISYTVDETIVYSLWIKFGLQNLSFFFMGLATINLLWEVYSKRNFTDEILEKVNLSRDIEKSGLIKIYKSFQDIEKEDWDEVLRENVKFLTCFFSSSTVWLRQHTQHFEKINKKKRPIKIYMPDYNNDSLLQALSIKDSEDKVTIKSKLNKTHNKFLDMQKKNPRLTIILVNKLPIMTFYMNENKIIIATYSILSKDEDVPTFLSKKDGFLYSFAKREIENLNN